MKLIYLYLTAWLCLIGLFFLIGLGHNGDMVKTVCGISVVIFGDMTYRVHGKPIIDKRRERKERDETHHQDN